MQTVQEASEPTTGLGLPNQYPDLIHLLLSEVVMPKVSGTELAIKGRMSHPGISVQESRCLH